MTGSSISKLALLLPLLVLAGGCTSGSLAKVVRELAHDPATVHVHVVTPWGSLVMDRAWPTNAWSTNLTAAR